MITLQQAKDLKFGDILHHVTNKNSDKTPQRWKVNGKVKTWKRDINRISIPVKHGLYSLCDYIVCSMPYSPQALFCLRAKGYVLLK